MTITNSAPASALAWRGQGDGRPRLVVVASHPIQYYAPFYRALARSGRIDVFALFCARIGLKSMLDPEMGVELAWKMDLTGGYGHEFLPEADGIKKTGFSEIDNPSVASALERHKPDVVLLHGYSNKTMLRALAWCRRGGVPAMMISDSSLHIGTPAWARLAKRLTLPVLLSQFSAFLSIGDSNRRYIEHYGVPASRIYRVPNMIDEGFWNFRQQKLQQRVKWREKLGLGENELAVLFVGKLIARKRPADLFAALRLIKAGAAPLRPIRVLLAGNGVELDALKAQAAAENLPATFLGFVNIDELPGIYCAADVLAHPAEIETFGVIVLEAAILGLALVLSDRVGALGPTSVARPDDNALVHRCGDVEGLAAALTRLANEPATLARLATRSAEISRDHDGAVSVGGTLAAIARCLRRTADTLGA